jgi:hypothetical protein
MVFFGLVIEYGVVRISIRLRRYTYSSTLEEWTRMR